MIALRLSEISRITGGRVFDAAGPVDTAGVNARAVTTAGADPVVDGPVVTDSREATAGSLYIDRKSVE